MSQNRRHFFRLSLLSAGLLASGVALANATIDPLLSAHMRKARPTESMQVILTFKQQTPVSAQQIAALKTLGIKKGVYMQRLPIMGVMATPAQVRELAKRKDVVSVYYNARLRYMNLEARQMSGSARVSTSPSDFGRAIPYSGRGVTVVVNDSGIDTTHPDLPMGSKVQENVFAAQNILASTTGIVPYTTVKGLPNSDLGSGHGNHCAGTVAGTGAASGGKYRGAAPGADLVGFGSGGVLLILDAVGGLDFALQNQFSYRHPIRVVSNSWGTGGKFNPDHPVTIATYKLYKDAGIVSVFAAGNDGPGENTHNPYSQAPWVISVGAGEKDGVLTSFSSRGNRGEGGEFVMQIDGSRHTYKNEPTIVATGVDIISTRTITGGVLATSAPQDAGLAPAHVPYYSHLSGTSMATPHVAGVVALMLEANPNLNPLQVKDIIQKTATNMSGRRSFEVGSGHLNAYAAVAMAQSVAQKTPLTFGKTVKTNRSFATLASAGASVDIKSETVLVVPQTGNNVMTFDVKAEDKLIELTGKVDTYAAPNGTGTSYVRAVLIDPEGNETRSPSSTLPGAFLLGPVTQVTVQNPKPGKWTLRVDGSQTNGQAVFTPEEMIFSAFGRSAGAASGPADVVSMTDEAAKTITGNALAAELVDAESDGLFKPARLITRFDLAQYLVFGANIRQSLPMQASAPSKFGTELSKTSAMYPYAEAVTTRGGVLRDLTYSQNPVMKLKAGRFAGADEVTREELAFSLVQALGDQAVTDAVTLGTNGTITTADNKEVVDSANIAADLRKHVKRAIDLGMITLVTGADGKLYFNPAGKVSKLDFAAAMLKYNAEYRRVED